MPRTFITWIIARRKNMRVLPWTVLKSLIRLPNVRCAVLDYSRVLSAFLTVGRRTSPTYGVVFHERRLTIPRNLRNLISRAPDKMTHVFGAAED